MIRGREDHDRASNEGIVMIYCIATDTRRRESGKRKIKEKVESLSGESVQNREGK